MTCGSKSMETCLNDGRLVDYKSKLGRDVLLLCAEREAGAVLAGYDAGCTGGRALSNLSSQHSLLRLLRSKDLKMIEMQHASRLGCAI